MSVIFLKKCRHRKLNYKKGVNMSQQPLSEENKMRIKEVQQYMDLCGVTQWKQIKEQGEYSKSAVFISQMMTGERPMSQENYIELLNAISRARCYKG